MIKPQRRPVVLMILDGWGLSDRHEGNAVFLAETPNFDRIWRECPHATLRTSGPDVGLPEGQMGNSEVGHMNIGAGRIVWQDLPRIDRAIASGEFTENPRLRAFVEKLRASGGTAHVMGLASPGGVHSHQRHMAAAARTVAEAGVPVVLHLFLDGRDVPPKSARGQIAELLAEVDKLARPATVMGRFWAMDRDRRWERTEAAFRAMVLAEGERAVDPDIAIASAYERGETDEFVRPTVIEGYGGMKDGDGVFCINFRADRVRQILGALLDPDFDAFDVSARPRFAAALAMTEYSEILSRVMAVMFPPQKIDNTLGHWLAVHGLRQFRLAETEKYPHVTFFFNGGIEEPEPGEERLMVPSPKVCTYDMKPEMSAPEVTERLVAAIHDDYDFILVNYANADMVGHTGVLEAAIRACEAVDAGIGAALAALRGTGGALLVTADHGNAETMIDPETGGPHTAHTSNPVPLVLFEDGVRTAEALRPGRLADLAPTILALMGLSVPAEMTGECLLRPTNARLGMAGEADFATSGPKH